MLRPANEHETAAFLLVERTLRRTRPRRGTWGLVSALSPEGLIERSSLGRLRLRFTGKGADSEPENRLESRPLSDEESSWWTGLRKMVQVAKPVADSEWNLVTMRIGPRVLSRLPLGGVVTYHPEGIPPFKGSLDPSLSGGRSPSRRSAGARLRSEVELLAAIDAFLREAEVRPTEPALAPQWDLARDARHPGHLGVLAQLNHGRRGSRTKWHKCPICRAPVVNGRFNQRIPSGSLRAGEGSIRDLRGGYLSRLHETYLISDPDSLIKSLAPTRPAGLEPARGPIREAQAASPAIQATLE